MGDENCGGELDLLHLPPTQFSSSIHGLLTADRQCLGGGGLGSGGWATTPPPPTPQAGRVTDSDGGGCEKSSATLSNGQFIQKHRGGNSNVADVTRIHYVPPPKALSFTERLLLRRVISLRAFSYGA
jgi:hypothetical protein